MFHTRFLSPTDQKCVESSTYWQFFYYRPPGKFRWFTHLGEIVKMSHTHTYIYMTLLIIDIDFLYQIDCTTFHSFLSWNIWKENCFLKFSKVGRSVNLWLVGEVDNHVAIYGSRVAEGFSAFQRRSCAPSCLWTRWTCCYGVAISVHPSNVYTITKKILKKIISIFGHKVYLDISVDIIIKKQHRNSLNMCIMTQ